MVADESGGWFTVTKKGHKKAAELRGDRQDNDAAEDVLKGSETGGFDRPGRKERDVFEDVTESSASQTETSSRTSRSASPSTATVSGEIEEHKAKSKRNRTRKSKPTPGQSPLSLLALNAAIENAKSTYGEDQRSQLGFVTDVFITHYRSSELPFRKFLQEQPIQKAAEVPLDSVPAAVVEASLAFYRGYDIAVLSSFASTLVEAAFNDISDSAAAVPPKANVGLLVALALVLRAVPAVAVLLSDSLLQGSTRYSSPQRLPFLLWTLAQAAIGNVSVGLAVWVRVLLPQVLGAHLAASEDAAPAKLRGESAAAALGFVDLCLAAVRPADEPEQLNLRGYPKWNAGTVALAPEENALVHGARQGVRWTVRKGKRAVEPVVPHAALDAIVRLSFRSRPVLGAKNNAHLHRHYVRLQELALEGIAHGGGSPSELVRLSLETAAEAAEGEPAVVEEAAHTIVMCLATASSKSAAAWRFMHAQQLLGSAAVLQNLAGSFPSELASGKGRKTLLELVQELQHKHSSTLASGKGEQLAAAQSAERACEALKTRLTSRAGTSISIIAAVAIVGGSALAAIALSQTKPFQDFAAQSDSGVIRAAMSKLTTVVEQLPPVVLNVAHEAASLAESATEKAQPLMHHVQDALGDLYEVVAAYSLQGLHAASLAQQAISARIHGLIAS